MKNDQNRFPSASIGIFDVIFVYIMNRFLGLTLGDIGLTTYMLCMDILVIGSIVNVGISETLAPIVPIYHTKHDYANLKHLLKTSLTLAIIFATIVTAFIWIWPEGFLALYKFNKMEIAGFVINAIKLYSLFFILSVLPSIMIFNYEAIERSALSTLISALFTLVPPLLCVITLYNLIGPNGIWIGFPVACLITIIIIFISTKIIQKKESEYSSIFFIKKNLTSKTKNFAMTENDSNARKECITHLKNLKTSDEFCNNVNKIFDINLHDTYVEVLIIDYDDNIHVDVKYNGEHENLEHLKQEFPKDYFKYAEILGFNIIEYVMIKN